MKSEENKPISQIIFDRRLEHGDTPDSIGKENCLRFNIFSPNFKIGLQMAQGIALNIWIQIICTLIAVRGKLISAAYCLTNMMRTVVALLNKNRANLPLIFPDFRLLKEIACRVPLTLWATKPEYFKTLILLLEVIADNCPMFQTFSGIDLERDVISKGKSCIIEIPTIYPAWLRLFIIDLLLAQILYGRIHRRHKVDRTEVIIYLDEADQDVSFISSDAAYEDAYSILAQLLRMGREYGIMVVLGVGTLGHMSKYISSSFQYKFIFNISEGEQILYAKLNLLLPPGAEQMLPASKPGECIVQQSQLGWPHPFKCKIDYDSHPFIPSKSYDELPELQKDINDLIAQYKDTNLRQSRRTSPRNDDYADKMLQLIIDNPYKPMVYLWRDLGNVPPFIQTSIRKQLENKGLASFGISRLSRRNLLLTLPTELAYKRSGLPLPKQKTRGGIIHTHFIHWVWKVGIQQGYKAKKEVIAPGTNHPVDVMWWVEDELWAFECISTCIENIIRHLQACFIDCKQISIVTIVADQQQILKRIKKIVREEFSLAPFDHRIRYELVSKYLEACWK
jgi:hypothetical protein